jgi:lipoprotein-anchoring transpeptidase ErfK/SrfK
MLHGPHVRYDVGFRQWLLKVCDGSVTGWRRFFAAATAVVAGCALPVAAGSQVTLKPCGAGLNQRMGSEARTWVALAGKGVEARSAPGGRVVARFGSVNANDYPTLFAVRGRVLDAKCRTSWYQVQLPVRPNGATGYVAARHVSLAAVGTRIEIDLSTRRLRLFRHGRLALRTPVAIGAPETPTPIGRFYVNQRLLSGDVTGPFGIGALGVSAFSPVLKDWVQGGPIAIHGTNEPWSIGGAESNGCIRVRNNAFRKLFDGVPAGTPVTIHP